MTKKNFLWDNPTYETDWVKDLAEDFFQMASDNTIGENGVLMVLFNLLPVVGANPLSIEIWFIISCFVGLLIFLRFYR